MAVAQTCYMGGKEKGKEERNEKCRFRYNVFISAVHSTNDYGGPKWPAQVRYRNKHKYE